MLNKNLLQMLMSLKNNTKSNHLINTESEKTFFAFTNKAVEDVLLNKDESFIKSGVWKRLRCILGQGLFTTEEPQHMNNKKEILPEFSSQKTKEYKDKVSDIIDSVLQSWSKKIHIRDEMRFLVFKVTMEIFFSKNVDSDFIEIRNAMTLASNRVLSNISDEELIELTKELKKYVKEVVNERMESKENKNDLLDMLINLYDNKKIDIDNLYDQAITIIFSGYESTAYLLEWAIYYLSINPKWQEKISQEIDVDAFINEVLRKCPPVWNTERTSIEDVNIDGIDLLAGTKVVVSSYVMHRNEDVFKDAHVFRPERWLEDQQLSKGDYFPFLFGKRQCIAKEFVLMETRLVLIKIAQNFNIRLMTDEVLSSGKLTYRPKNPIIIYVENK